MPLFNEIVDSLVSFIPSHENPYCTPEKQLLKNVVTQIYAGRTVANSLLNFLEDVKKRFNEFYAKVYVDKVSLFHDKISRYNLPQLDDVNEELPNNSLKSRQFMEKESQKPMKSLMIAKDKNSGGIDKILQHDLSSKSVLFDGNLRKKANNKSQLISELEKYFEVNDYLIDLSERQTVIVDFIHVCYQINENYQRKIPFI